MKRKHFMVLALFCVVVIASIFVFRGCRQVYDNSSLDGDYLFTMVEVHQGGGDEGGDGKGKVIYLEVAGTMSFDGAGKVVMKNLMIRSSEDGKTQYPPDSGEQDSYQVNDDGSFTLGSESSKMLHGQIVLGESCLLMDGSQLGTGTDPDTATLYLNHAIAMKRNITPRNPPTYSSRSLEGDYVIMGTIVGSMGEETLYYRESGGTISFSGDGSFSSTITERQNYRNKITITTETGTDTISVNADGSLVSPHGQIVLDGNCVLVDGTLQEDVNDYLDTAILMKRVLHGKTPVYDNASLKGDYLFIMTNVNSISGVMTYYDGCGSMNFDGNGSVVISRTYRAADGTAAKVISETATYSYSVNPDGTFLINDTKRPTHGQIALNSNGLLLDGTVQGLDPQTPPFRYLQHGVAMKRNITMGR